MYYNNKKPGNSSSKLSDKEEEVKKDFKKENTVQFQTSWITNEADSILPTYAEEAGSYMAKNKLANSKIRSIYSEIKRIQISGYDRQKASFFLLKPKVAYAVGRDINCKGLILFKIIFDQASQGVKDAKTYQNFCNLMEAILAYHKANGGKE